MVIKLKNVKFKVLLGFILLFEFNIVKGQTQNNAWNSFSNMEYKFKVNYPTPLCKKIYTNNCLMSDSLLKIGRKNHILNYGEDLVVYYVAFESKFYPVFSIVIFKKPDTIDFKTFCTKTILLDGIYKETDIHMEDFIFYKLPAIKATYESKIEVSGIVKNVFIQKRDLIYEFSVSKKTDPISYDCFFEELFSTFQMW